MLTSSKENTNTIYDTLHWTIQKKLSHQVSISKNVLENSEIHSDTTDAISYEKQILLMNTSDSVKSKAMTKLKEIKNGKGDSSTKAVQYLDGLLKIPFGLYRSEFIHELQNFKNRMVTISKSFLQKVEKPILENIEWAAKVYHTAKHVEDNVTTSHMLAQQLRDMIDMYEKLYIPHIESLCLTLSNKKLKKYARLNDIDLEDKRTKSKIVHQLHSIFPDPRRLTRAPK